jgi:hypothetical protein
MYTLARSPVPRPLFFSALVLTSNSQAEQVNSNMMIPRNIKIILEGKTTVRVDANNVLKCYIALMEIF